MRLAVRFPARLRGLIGYRRDELGCDVLVIAPCRAIHTWLMREHIDVAFVGIDGTVLRVVRDVGPWRWGIACPGAVAVLERFARTGAWLEVGTVTGLRYDSRD